MNREQQTQHGQGFDQLAGMPVFSSDNQPLGTIEGVVTPSGTTQERYMIVSPPGVRPGTDQRYVPASEIRTIAVDRVILERPLGAVTDQHWLAPPGRERGARR